MSFLVIAKITYLFQRGPPKKQFKQRSDNQPKDGDGDQKDPSVSPSQKVKIEQHN